MAKAFDRSKYKASKVDAFIDAEKDHPSGRDGRPGYVAITDGFNLFRLYPAHDPENESWIYPKVVSWLPVKSKGKDGETEIKGKPIFNSKIHAGWEKDLVEEYIEHLRAKMQEKYSTKKEVQAAMAPVYDSKNKTAINPKWGYVVYADKLKGLDVKKEKIFGRLELKVSMKKQMNVLCASEDVDEPIETDPFTDPDTGLPIEVVKDTTLDANEMYKLKLRQDFHKEGKEKGKVKFYPLSDEDLLAFEKVESLHSQFKNCFVREDFDAQVSGLEYFDKKYKFGLFQDEDFIDVVEELSGWAESLEERKKEGSEDKDGEESGEEGSEDKFSEMDRKELKQFISKNKLGIVVTPSMSDDDIRELIREAIETPEPAEEEPEENEEPEGDEEPEENEDAEPPFEEDKTDKKDKGKNQAPKASSFRGRLKKNK